jgi:hypothetical protein
MIRITPFGSHGRRRLFRFLNAIELFFGDIPRMRVRNQQIGALAKTRVRLIVKESGVTIDAVKDMRRSMNLPIEMTVELHLPGLTYARFPLRIDFPFVRETWFTILLVPNFDRRRFAITARWKTAYASFCWGTPCGVMSGVFWQNDVGV